MNRRSVLRASLALLGAAAWPGLVADAFASETTSSPEVVRASFERARSAGRPLLVLVVPTAVEHRWAHGELLGAALMHGPVALRAALAVPVLVCATPEHLATVVPELVVPDDAWLVLVETDGDSPRGSVLAGTPPAPAVTGRGQEDWAEVEEQAIRRRIDWLAERAVPFLDAGGPARVRQAEAADPAGVALARASVTSSPSAAAVARAPAVAAAVTGARRSACQAALVATLEAGPLRDGVPGSRWARPSGCGVQVEGEEPVLVKCGMGHVTPLAERMLTFWTQGDG